MMELLHTANTVSLNHLVMTFLPQKCATPHSWIKIVANLKKL